jgi:predicted nucleic acid-binding protein
MILADTAVWIAHRRTGDATLQRLLMVRQVLGHPLIAGELAVGSLRQRHDFLRDIDNLPRPVIADDHEVRSFIEVHKLFGRGVGYIDLHLLLSVRLTPEALLWTRDKRLHEIAGEMSIAYDEPAALLQ